ncbi:MAG: sortase [Actinobacteria bacterium]|nr:sortase [Actinomycetota bacterium]
MSIFAPESMEFAPPPAEPKPSWYQTRVKPRIAVTGPPRPAKSGLTWVLATLSLLTLWFVFFAGVLSALQEAHNQHDAYTLFREELTQLSPRVAPLGGVIAPDAPVALISAPELGLKNVVVVEGTAAGDLTHGPGHKRDTPLPGQAGVSVLLGRAHLFGGPFGHLSRARPGTVITAITGQGESKYKVEDVRRAGDPFPLPLQDGQSRLTLISSEGGSWLNGWVPERAVYVDALLQGKALPAPPGRLSSVPKAETTMTGDSGALFLLVLWLPVLVLAVGGLVWLSERWGRWQSWLIGAPVLLAALWGVSQTAVQLLPNVM